VFAQLLAQIERGLRQPLPGPAAQAVMAPRPQRSWPRGFNPARVRHAAGLLLVVPRAGQPRVVLTVRSDALGRHGGQVSLPGGVMEPGENFEQTALREAREEVGLSPDGVRTLGALTAIDIVVSGFRLQPVVAAAERAPDLRPTDGEVARILEVGIEELMDPGTIAWCGFRKF
jgi:8-oxo-dGTP pyrophosphatase MutT (NUDIX family)